MPEVNINLINNRIGKKYSHSTIIEFGECIDNKKLKY